MSERKPAVESGRQRRHRARPTPQWLLKKQELDEIARRRTLMILNVLSGQLPVTDAIAQGQMSRGHYYQLEERALNAVLLAMEPGASPGRSPETTTRLLQLEDQVKQLEVDKRRLERLLTMTRKVLKPRPLKIALGRPSSGKDGKSASAPSTTPAKSGSDSPTSSSTTSTR